jgi:hypothetical protein
MEDNTLLYNVFNLQTMLQVPPVKLTGWFRRVSCYFGLHIWGFSHCLACGKMDRVLAPVILQWMQELEQSERAQLILYALHIAEETGLDLNQPLHTQLHCH